MLLRLVLLTFAITVIQVTAIKQPRSVPKYTEWRLPRWVLPRHYKLRLLPFIEEGNFTTAGQVDILLECMEPTQMIVLHIADIRIVQDEGLQVHDLIESRRVPIQSYIEDKTRQLLVIGTKNETLQVGKYYKLSIRFIGQLNDKLNGFYRASYTENGIKKYLATTQFSPTDARRAFPCFDEPGLKAVFQITLGRLKSRKAHSNMPIKRTYPNEDLPDYVWDEFDKTLPMSTYILAFIVSEFEGLDSPELELQDHTQFRTWTRPSAGKQTEYARILGPRVLRFFENYFNISFPLPKLDMFAIPDFVVSGMENWGLITYRETALLYDPVRSSGAEKQRIAHVIGHELAHQWFGNLVTMDFWDDLWLKEGFASYLMYVGLDVVEPSLQIGQQFTISETQKVFEVDSLMSSHAMSFPVKKRNEINELFDSIPYSKGPAVIRMFAGFIGQSKFQHGLTFYLDSKKYQSAVNDDLWKAMSNQSIEALELPSDITTIMNSWSLQTGYPIVTVRRNYDFQSAIVTQERFYLLGDRNSSDFPLWWIPLTYTTNFNTTFQAWMMGTEDGIELELPSTSTEWVLFNVDQIGYYRVNYDETNWKLIIQQLLQDHRAVSTLSRSQLIDDSLNIARMGSLPYSVALQLSSYLRAERDFAPWFSALTAFNYLDSMLYHTASKDKLREYIKWLILPTYEQIGFEERKGDSQLVILNRNQIISWACRLGVSECVNNATSLYKLWMAQPDNSNWVNSNYKKEVACAAIANSGDEEWDFALERYLSTDLSSEKEMLLNALSCSNSPEALNTLLEWALDANSGIRRQDSSTVFRSVSTNPLGSSMVFDFALLHWDEMVKAFPSLNILGRLVEAISKTLDNETHLKNLVTLSEGGRGDLGTATRSVQQALERTRINLEWKKRRLPTVTKLLDTWFRNQTFS
ncbi:aminopeptidase N-like [Daphnia pulicaria]|uniref:aminopeptidase N-like n=1 Tax=Daphnia pulicaria TaxID=35523 RepID=UPI001EEA46B5|nr:aminopeptidase N-like [Daphnia pulicaria]